MTNEFCKHCACLREDENGKWVCDELETEITDIAMCPEEKEKKEYTICIREILETSVTVKAESVESAKSMAEELYYNEDIVLTEDDFSYREMKEENEPDTEWEDF